MNNLDRYTNGELKNRWVLQVYSFSWFLSLLVILEVCAGLKMSECKPPFTALLMKVRQSVSLRSDKGSADIRMDASS